MTSTLEYKQLLHQHPRRPLSFPAQRTIELIVKLSCAPISHKRIRLESESVEYIEPVR